MKKLFIYFFMSFLFSFASMANDVAVDVNAAEEFNDIPQILKDQDALIPLDPGLWSNGHWSKLPVLGDQARAQGYTIEPPFVIAVQYVNQSQQVQQVQGSTQYSNIKTKNLFNIVGLDLGLHPDGTPDILVTTGRTKEHTQTKGVRMGVWIFPFLQVYGLANKISGHATTPSTSLTQLEFNFAPGFEFLKPIAEQALRDIFGDDYKGNGKILTRENVRMDLSADSYGGGITMAGGYKKSFFMLDLNYTYSNFDFSDDYAKTLVISTRVGYDTRIYNRPFRIWVGFMSQYVSSKITGQLSALQFDGLTGVLINAINPDGKGEFEVRQHLVKPVNGLVGFRYTFTPYTAILMEGGYGGSNGRTSFLATFEVLF